MKTSVSVQLVELPKARATSINVISKYSKLGSAHEKEQGTILDKS